MDQNLYMNTEFELTDVGNIKIEETLRCLMNRNVATEGFVFIGSTGAKSKPGCIIASPSRPVMDPETRVTSEDYVHHWVRDAGIVIIENSKSQNPDPIALSSYINFSKVCQEACEDLGFACFRVDGTPRTGGVPLDENINPQPKTNGEHTETEWNSQGDGPAIRILSIIEAIKHLRGSDVEMAKEVIRRDVDYLSEPRKEVQKNLWEEVFGHSFFARIMQRHALQRVVDENIIILSDENRKKLASLIATISENIEKVHWNGEYYESIVECGDSKYGGRLLNSDLLLAINLGNMDPLEERVLKSVGCLVQEFHSKKYPINDQDRPLGPMIGRYKDDYYDGDWNEPNNGHPWPLCSCALAEYYYRLAERIRKSNEVPDSKLYSNLFFDPIKDLDVDAESYVLQLRSAGDRILQAVLYHSNNLEISEQVDSNTGFCKSVRSLSWSYAGFLSALRSRALTSCCDQTT